MDDPWGVSCSLKLYDNPWKVQTVLTNNDTSNRNRLTLSIKDVTKILLPVLGENAKRNAQTVDGVKLWFWDVDTEFSHQLLLKQESHDDSRGQEQPSSAAAITTLKIKVPNNKAGDTIRYLQYNSGAKIQIARDADADPHSTTRRVELIGSLDSIEKAEELISAVIAKADAGGSPALVA
ncbi:hypothetical protein K1719_037128 [Acacia pycnantha]|nr:hypothetical protein K1719_037128 [Acacia pycnantha]